MLSPQLLEIIGLLLGSTISMPRCSAGARPARVRRKFKDRVTREGIFSSGNDSGSSSEESSG